MCIRDSIITLEDPVEFVHQHKNCIVNQREIGTDTHTFGGCLLYTSDAADERSSVDLGGRRIIKKKKK